MRKRRLFTRLGIAGTLLAVAGTLLLAPPAQSVEASLSAVNSSSWQTNASVQGLAVAGGKAYAGGRFTSVRPPGAAAGTGEVAQAYLAAFDAGTGALVSSFNPVLNGQVYAVAASADGSRIFVGGDFTTVDGQTRNRIAAFDTATGALVANWKPSVSYRVKTIAVSGTTVYFGGSFGLVNNQTRNRLAAVSTDTGTLLPWAPDVNGDVYAVDAADDASKVYAGGQFSTVNGTNQNTVTSLDPVTGAVLPFPGASAVPLPNGSCTTRVKTIDASGDTVYFGNGGDGGGCFDGTWAVDIATNTLKWKNQCLGATEAVKVVNGWLYKGSHAHDCANQGAGGFPQGFDYRFLLSEKLSDGTLGPWYPNTDADPNSATNVGPLAFATGGDDLWVGGDFLHVNGAAQQGLTHFTNALPGAAPAKPAKLTPYSVRPGAVQINFPTVVDNDDSTLTYRLLRGFSNTTIATWTVKSTPWDRPWVHYTDTDVTPGESTNYRVEVTDGSTTIRGNYSDPVTVATTASTAYDQIVNSDGPQAYWRLGEPAGTATSVDSSGQSNNGPFTGVTLGGAGAIAGDTAMTTSTTTGRMVGEKASSMPQQFTVEAWVKQSGLNRGGRIIGFGNGKTQSSAINDRMLYMRTNGAIVFGVNDGGQRTLTSALGKNDGNWHHVVGTYDNGAMKLYVDGALSGSAQVGQASLYYGWWRVGYDLTNSWPGGGATQTGMGIDEAAVYPYALTSAQVQSHYAAR
ncbi:LamG-like jellyroll fold domain-containing protein [Kribbella sp.]|uniref:LamG-like jellyroll fold domain-containing protein n=1 Tax=Kribbella sp. TaxID=1871183 RepID=UPI002D5C7892|nr:LamG-like jellyroll fold domain-containing protein [Kribbella sp.]HZX08897.1 LamG-like jellyroll fold domain-containing protein [Kribbella sp.]